MSITMLGRIFFSVLTVVITSVLVFLTTVASAYLFQISDPWNVGLAATMGAFILVSLYCISMWITLCLSARRLGWDSDYGPTLIDYMLGIPAICLILCSALFALVGISILQTGNLSSGIGATASGGVILGVLVIISCSVVLIILTCCQVRTSCCGGLLNNRHFVENRGVARSREDLNTIFDFDRTSNINNNNNNNSNNNNIITPSGQTECCIPTSPYATNVRLPDPPFLGGQFSNLPQVSQPPVTSIQLT